MARPATSQVNAATGSAVAPCGAETGSPLARFYALASGEVAARFDVFSRSHLRRQPTLVFRASDAIGYSARGFGARVTAAASERDTATARRAPPSWPAMTFRPPSPAPPSGAAATTKLRGLPRATRRRSAPARAAPSRPPFASRSASGRSRFPGSSSLVHRRRGSPRTAGAPTDFAYQLPGEQTGRPSPSPAPRAGPGYWPAVRAHQACRFCNTASVGVNTRRFIVEVQGDAGVGHVSQAGDVDRHGIPGPRSGSCPPPPMLSSSKRFASPFVVLVGSEYG